jgi:hypothetical protein
MKTTAKEYIRERYPEAAAWKRRAKGKEMYCIVARQSVGADRLSQWYPTEADAWIHAARFHGWSVEAERAMRAQYDAFSRRPVTK